MKLPNTYVADLQLVWGFFQICSGLSGRNLKFNLISTSSLPGNGFSSSLTVPPFDCHRLLPSVFLRDLEKSYSLLYLCSSPSKDTLKAAGMVEGCSKPSKTGKKQHRGCFFLLPILRRCRFNCIYSLAIGGRRGSDSDIRWKADNKYQH